jgi:hypothetical protein
VSTETQRCRDLRALVERHRSRFERAPGGGLGGCPHGYLRASWHALPTPDRAACEALAGLGAVEAKLVAGWLHIVPTGGFILPCQPVLEWGPSEQDPCARIEELVLDVDVADGATLHFVGSPRRDPEHEGHRLTVHADGWYWVSPVVGRDRISLVWWVR